MAAERHDLEKRLSGGVAETDPNLSLGGAMSTAVIFSQDVSIVTPISGVTLIEGRGNSAFGISPSVGNVQFVLASTALRWTPPLKTFGALVDVSVDGRFTLPGPDDEDLLIVDVVAASLPIADTNSNVNVETLPNTLFDDVGAVEAFLGATNFRCYYVRNRSAGDTLFGVKVFISAQPSPGGDTLALGLDPAGINGTATTIVDEDTAPGGVSFSSPTSYAGGLLIGDLTPGDNHAIWQRRTVPPGSTFPAPRDNSEISHGMFF
jgi:hypothetical protein